MGKPLKISISLLVCGSIFLTGCGTASTSLPSELAGKTGNYPAAINIYAPDFFTNSSAGNAETAKQEWLDEMSERYDVNFRVYSNSNTYSESSNSSAADQETDDTSSAGIVSVSTDSISSLKYGIKTGNYIPLEDYLADNAVWNALPDDFKSLFEVDGHIYAIPASVSRVQYIFAATIMTREDKTVQQMINEYKEKMLNMGGNDMLDEMNAAIGKKTAYYYG